MLSRVVSRAINTDANDPKASPRSRRKIAKNGDGNEAYTVLGINILESGHATTLN